VTPKAGYVFSVLTTQGAAASGGTKSYVVASNMTLGYALSAVPGSYDGTGRDTFIINNNGTIFQKDVTAGAHQTHFNPDSTWAPSE
jgi:hypothetical protein